jgi:hypothetical protein
MKRKIFVIAILVMMLVLTSCASATPETTNTNETTSILGNFLSVDYEDAASIRSQLAYGTIQIIANNNTITAEEAAKLIPLWQGIMSLSGSSTTAEEEITAIQDQIVKAMTEEQLKIIADMKITSTQLNEYYAMFGIAIPTPNPDGTTSTGSGKDMTAEEKAARQATAIASGMSTGTGTGQTSKTLLYEKVIESLTGIVK